MFAPENWGRKLISLTIFYPSLSVLFAMILNFFILIVFVVGLVALIKWLKRPAPAEGKPNALEVAKLRYARGEISKAEFDEIKKNL